MELNNTKDIFAELLRAASRGYGERSVENPAVNFIRDVKAGDYDYISDEEYKEVLDSVERMCAPWQTMQTKTVKELLINALEDVDLSDDDVEDISASLMSAYIKTNHDRIPKASSDCNGKTVDLSICGCLPVILLHGQFGMHHGMMHLTTMKNQRIPLTQRISSRHRRQFTGILMSVSMDRRTQSVPPPCFCGTM